MIHFGKQFHKQCRNFFTVLLLMKIHKMKSCSICIVRNITFYILKVQKRVFVDGTHTLFMSLPMNHQNIVLLCSYYNSCCWSLLAVDYLLSCTILFQTTLTYILKVSCRVLSSTYQTVLEVLCVY